MREKEAGEGGTRALTYLPVLLEEGDEEVARQHDVSEELVLSHLDVSDGDTEAKDLLKLELDGGADVQDLVSEVLEVSDGTAATSSACGRLIH
jgi:hypothetical protein